MSFEKKPKFLRILEPKKVRFLLLLAESHYLAKRKAIKLMVYNFYEL